ncbi:MAG: polysaccharide biosynthesis/export family protein [Sedimentisphaerales bacterium]|nr:polysaccharide biosynthesis/export family protein [Sedimentisphaerales bacterium]
MKAYRYGMGLLWIGMVVSLTGCFSSRRENIEVFLKPQQTEVTAKNYILRPPDEIQVLSTSIPEIHEQIQVIRPDGQIFLESIGNVVVVGLTPQQAAQAIAERAASLYTLKGDNPIAVKVNKFGSKVYHILGEVQYPGPKICTGRDTVLTALSDANIQVTGWAERVQVIRPSADPGEKPKAFEVNFERMRVHGDLQKNVLLQEGDIIYVPPTVLSGIAMVIEEFVRPIGRALAPALTISRIGSSSGY